jgi:hypothetical protein
VRVDRGDVHLTLAAHRTAGEVDPGEPMQQHSDRFRLCVRRRGLAEEGTAPYQRASTCAIREQTKAANAHEAARHDVQEKASEEFVGLERHDRHAVVVGMVLPVKPDTAVAVINEPIVRQRDAVGVPPEIVEDLLGAGEGPLRIHDPVDRPQATQKAVARKRSV